MRVLLTILASCHIVSVYGISSIDINVCINNGSFPSVDMDCSNNSIIHVDSIQYFYNQGAGCNTETCGQPLTNSISSTGLTSPCTGQSSCTQRIPNNDNCTGSTVRYRCIAKVNVTDICEKNELKESNRIFLSTPSYPELANDLKEESCECSIRGSSITSITILDLILKTSSDGTRSNLFIQYGDIYYNQTSEDNSQSTLQVYNHRLQTTTTTADIIFTHKQINEQKLWIEIQGKALTCYCNNTTATPTIPSAGLSSFSTLGHPATASADQITLSGPTSTPTSEISPDLTTSQTPEISSGLTTNQTPETSPGLTPTQTPGTSSGLTPTQTPGTSSGLTPTQTPGTSSGLTPTQTPGTSSGLTPTQTLEISSGLTPTRTPGTSSGLTPTKTLGTSSDLTPILTPGTSSGLTPTQTPGTSSGQTPTQTLEISSGLTPTRTPGTSSGLTPTKTLGTSSDLTPTQTPGTSSGLTPTKTLGTSSDLTPILTPGTSSGLTPTQTPGTSSGQTPTQKPGISSGLTPTPTPEISSGLTSTNPTERGPQKTDSNLYVIIGCAVGSLVLMIIAVTACVVFRIRRNNANVQQQINNSPPNNFELDVPALNTQDPDEQQGDVSTKPSPMVTRQIPEYAVVNKNGKRFNVAGGKPPNEVTKSGDTDASDMEILENDLYVPFESSNNPGPPVASSSIVIPADRASGEMEIMENDLYVPFEDSAINASKNEMNQYAPTDLMKCGL